MAGAGTACCVLRAPIWRKLGGGRGHCVLRAACSDLEEARWWVWALRAACCVIRFGGSEVVVAGGAPPTTRFQCCFALDLD